MPIPSLSCLYVLDFHHDATASVQLLRAGTRAGHGSITMLHHAASVGMRCWQCLCVLCRTCYTIRMGLTSLSAVGLIYSPWTAAILHVSTAAGTSARTCIHVFACLLARPSELRLLCACLFGESLSACIAGSSDVLYASGAPCRYSKTRLDHGMAGLYTSTS
jgi:hypothetical protein